MTPRPSRPLALAAFSALLLGSLLAGGEAVAQAQPLPHSQAPTQAPVQRGTACLTRFGLCPTPSAPLQSACRCQGNPGRVTYPPPEWGSQCRINHTTKCKVDAWPVGSPCTCASRKGRIVP
ncbi:exported hypothetical protein [Rubrivivax sp. A210]|uniref:hypothetical protein n=1 Tax=Rubrivivax sp. A210 TaxID=2772301 RepID=UPI00191ACA44|nr:hypothetical protein [Rubrivivax sp. A210]CAD5369781.1 exported hypothetical protein [Rubrivivax sp. A210]